MGFSARKIKFTAEYFLHLLLIIYIPVFLVAQKSDLINLQGDLKGGDPV